MAKPGMAKPGMGRFAWFAVLYVAGVGSVASVAFLMHAVMRR